jgi:hypothetical protein
MLTWKHKHAVCSMCVLLKSLKWLSSLVWPDIVFLMELHFSDPTNLNIKTVIPFLALLETMCLCHALQGVFWEVILRNLPL